MQISSLVALMVSTLAAGAALAAPPAADPEFLLGTWTSEGVCTRSEVFARQGERFTATTRGKIYVGSIVVDGDSYNSDFIAADGASKQYVMRYINDNRVRLMYARLCESRVFPGECMVVRLDDIEYYYQRCDE